MAWSAVHEQEDDIISFRCEVTGPGGDGVKWVDLGRIGPGLFLSQQGGEERAGSCQEQAVQTLSTALTLLWDQGHVCTALPGQVLCTA